MRSLSFVDFLNFRDIYTTNSKNLCLFDVDHDGDQELVVGFWDSGPLLENGEADAENLPGAIYVLKHHRIWKANREVGMVLCVTAGNIVGKGEPWILALCADSHCYAFDAKCTNTNEHRSHNTTSTKASIPREKLSQYLPLKMVHHQLLAYNAKDIQIIESDGCCEVAVAHSDRVVRLYTWCPSEERHVDDDGGEIPRGRFVILMKWELAGQVNSISTHPTPDSGSLLLASQPGGGFAILHRKFEKYQDNIVPTLVYYPPRITNTRNLDARTWIVGNVRGGVLPTEDHVTAQSKSPEDATNPIVGVCMADGTVLLINPATEDEAERVLWCIQLHFRGELFGLSKVNLTRGHTDELCVCAWDGTTYVFSHRKQVLRFPMGQSCQAFLAGWYAVAPGRNEPVFVYATCEHSLLIYHNLSVDHLVEPCLFHELSNDTSIASSLRALHIDPDDRDQLRQTVHHYLYEVR
ncbi:hypothetical protein CRM22_008925 [Opisthorchis felineus]|uniref:Integrin-alpha FG-GAP repeat-containing protein 2 n=2 Tax=Opisthorchis felineus TaxID=147828 RepID=A0A4S2L912_OPIFE|nr:hypothetical protein CRM22_008925 [Opisthorchis felineus]